MKFKDLILSMDPSIEDIPAGYKRIGDKVILRYGKLLRTPVGIAVMQAYPWCTGVFQHLTTIGEARKPQLINLAGDQQTIVTHKENGCFYKIDIENITFSGGNRGLRKRLAETVTDGENLLDMFAAIGNLSLQPIVKRKINSILIEKNAHTYEYLLQTLIANDISTKTYNEDCRNVNISSWADRIFLGYHNVDRSHIQAAIESAKKHAILHLHPLAKPGNYQEWSEKYCSWIKDFGAEASVTNIIKIKNYSPGLHHIEVVISINR